MTEGRFPVELAGVGLPLLVPDPQNRPNVYAIKESRAPAGNQEVGKEQIYTYAGGWGGLGHRARLMEGPFYERARGLDCRSGRFITPSPATELTTGSGTLVTPAAELEVGTGGGLGRLVAELEQAGYIFEIYTGGYFKYLGEQVVLTGGEFFPYQVRGAVVYQGMIHVGGVPGVDMMRRLDTVGPGEDADTWSESLTFDYTPLTVEPERFWAQSSVGGIRSLPAGQDAITGGLWSGEFEIDDPTVRINSGISLGGQLVIGKEDGMFSFDEALVVRALTPKLRLGRSAKNFSQLVEHDGAIWGPSEMGPVRYEPGASEEAFLYNVLGEDTAGYGAARGVLSVGRELYLALDSWLPGDDAVGRAGTSILALREPDQGDRTFLKYVPHNVVDLDTGAGVYWELDDYDVGVVGAVSFPVESGPARVLDSASAFVRTWPAIALGLELDHPADSAIAVVIVSTDATPPVVLAVNTEFDDLTLGASVTDGDRHLQLAYMHRGEGAASEFLEVTLANPADEVLVGAVVLDGTAAAGAVSAAFSVASSAAVVVGSDIGQFGLSVFSGHERARMVEGGRELVATESAGFTASVVVGQGGGGQLYSVRPDRVTAGVTLGRSYWVERGQPDGGTLGSIYYRHGVQGVTGEPVGRGLVYLGQTDCGSADEAKLLTRVVLGRLFNADEEDQRGAYFEVRDGTTLAYDTTGWLPVGTQPLYDDGEGVTFQAEAASPFVFNSIDARFGLRNGGNVFQGVRPITAAFPIHMFYRSVGRVLRQVTFTVFWDARMHDERSVIGMREHLVAMVGTLQPFRYEEMMREAGDALVESVGEIYPVVQQGVEGVGIDTAGYAFDVSVVLWELEER